MSFGVRLSLLGVTGVAFGVLSSAERNLALAFAVAAASIAFASELNRRVVCLWVMWCALAVAHGAHAREYAQMPPPEWVLSSSSPLLLEGRLTRDAAVSVAGVRLELNDIRITADARTAALPQLDVLAIVGGTMATAAVEQWTSGRRVRMPVRLRVPAFVRNPGSPSVRWQALTRPFDLIAAVKSGSLVEVKSGGRLEEIPAAARRYVRGVTHEWLRPLGVQSAGVVTAILIGDRAGLDDEVTRRLQLAGTFHVIAISGGNVAILTTMCFVVLRLITRREREAIWLTLLALAMYGVVVGRDPSVARAILAASIYLGLRLRGLLPQALNVLALTALGCVSVVPLMVLDVGAWLSFGATFGLVTILPRMIGSRVPGAGFWSLGGGSWVRTILLATVAAELVIVPIMASVFMRVGLAGLPLNFVAIPAMTITQVSGLALCFVAPWWHEGAAVFARVSHWATGALTGSASLVEVAPWLSWRVPPPPIAVVCLYYVALIAATFWSRQRLIGRGALWVTAVCALAVATGPWTFLERPGRGWLRITVTDVGQGEAVAVQLPYRHALLVDAGGSSGGFDVGGRVVTPALWASGIRRLDWLALTHGDVDHIGGARRVAEDLRPREIWEGVPVPGHVMVDELRAASPQIAWRRLSAGHQIEMAGASIEVQHPPVPSWERRRVRNDDSLVLRVRYGLVEVLLTGDAGPEFEAAFTRDATSPPIRILKVGHHGSKTSSSEPFLDAYAPTAAVISAGQGNLFGHPAPMVIDRLRHRDIDVFRTDRDGAIVIETDGRVARVRTVTGRVLTVAMS